MSRIGSKLRSLEDGKVAFMCPGCDEFHAVRVEGAGSPKWGYNGNPNNPTFTPSVRVQGVKNRMSDEDWDAYDKMDVQEDREKILADHRFASCCHSFVTDGRIQFLSDCTHALAGQTVDLPDLRGDGQ